MRPKEPKDVARTRPESGETRSPGAPLEKELTDTFNEVQPESFRGNSRYSIDAAVSDPDVDDTIGGE